MKRFCHIQAKQAERQAQQIELLLVNSRQSTRIVYPDVKYLAKA